MKKLLYAINFAARKHSSQRRKNDEATPYINHPIEVAQYLSEVGGVEDEDVLVAAVLHDTIEDTQTTYDEVKSLFGVRVARLVSECTDDKSLSKEDRKRLQIDEAPKKSNDAKLIKVADKSCNLRSMISDPPVGWSTQRQLEYFLWAEKVLEGCFGVNRHLDADALLVLEDGLKVLRDKD